MRHLISFATEHYAARQNVLCESAATWFDRMHVRGPESLPDSFVERHAEHFEYERGFGWWIWKPLIIMELLVRLRPDEVVVYCDAQIRFIADPTPMLHQLRKTDGVLLFHQKREGHVNRVWTKRDCFRLMDCDTREYHEGPQLNVAISAWSNTPLAQDVLREWYHWCSDLRVVSDSPSEAPPLFGFRDHRHDQSILSLMAIRRKLQTFPDPSQFGNGYEMPTRGYGQIVVNDRSVSAPYPIPCLEKKK